MFWQPSTQGYVSRLTVPFGERLRLPAPSDCDLDTSAFALAPQRSDKGAD